MTLQELVAQLAARREHYAHVHAQVAGEVVLDDVIALLEQVDGTESARGRDHTTREAAALLGLDNHRTVERYCRAGRLPGAYKTSGETGDWRVPATAIEAFRRAATRNASTRHLLRA